MNEFNAQALAVVGREISATLNEARLALEASVERPGDAEPLQRVADLTAATRGVLEVVGVHGGALLAREAHAVAAHITARGAGAGSQTEALDALMRAIVQLPAYVERTLGGGRDVAIVLLPLMNDLRAVRGAPLMSEGAALGLSLACEADPPPRVAPKGEPQVSVGHWARKLRTQFQLALLGWLKDERPARNLAVLAEVAARLESIATVRASWHLWWVATAVFEAIRDGGLEPAPALKRLLGQCDRELKRLYEQGEELYATAPPAELLNNLLYALARSTSSGRRVKAVKQAFRLHELLPLEDVLEQERDSLSAPSVKLMQTVAVAIKEDLAKVKDALDIYTRKGGQPEELAPQIELLKKIGDTLAVLGLGPLRDRVHGELARLSDIAARRVPPQQESLVGMAAALISVEDTLDQSLLALIMPHARPADGADAVDNEFRPVAEAVLREALVNLARVKEAISQAVQPGGDPTGIDAVPQLARGITSALLMLGRVRAVAIVERLGRAIVRLLGRSDVAADVELLQRLADAVVGIECYLETLQGGRYEPIGMLETAEQNLRQVEAATAAAPVAPAEKTLVIAAPPEAAASAEATLAVRGLAGEPLPTELPPPAAPPSVVAPARPAFVAHVDPELLGVFIEEAHEEIERIHQLFPLWCDNEADRESLVRVRRSFHTLKGSGRMVGATRMGDFAWAIENLLNRVIDGTRNRSTGMLALLTEAVAALPGIVDELEHGTPAPAPIEALVARAQALAEGRQPDEATAAFGPEGRPEAPVHETTEMLPQLDEQQAATAASMAPFSMAPSPAPPIGAAPPVEKTQVMEALAPAVEKTEVIAALPERVAEAPVQRTVVIEALPPAAAAESVEPTVVVEALQAPPLEPTTEAAAELPAVPPEPVSIDRSLQDIFRKEVESHLEVVRRYLRRAWTTPGPHRVPEELYRACHTLRGASRTADSTASITLAEPLHRWVMRLFDHDLAFDEDGLAALADSITLFEDVIEGLDGNTRYERALRALVARIESYDALARQRAAEAVSAAATGDTVIAAGPAAVEPPAAAAAAPAMPAIPAAAPEPLPTAPAREEPEPTLSAPPAETPAGEPTLADLDLPDEQDTQAGITGAYGLHFDATITVPAEVAAEALAAGPAIGAAAAPGAETLEAELAQVLAAGAAAEAAAAGPGPAAPVASPPATAPMPAEATGAADEAGIDDEFDPDIAAIFCEEATELLEGADRSLVALRAERGNRARVAELQRALHTLKGGARMAGLRAMGDLSHEVESLLIQAGAGIAPVDERAFDVLQASFDELGRMRDQVTSGRGVKPARALIDRIRALGRGAAAEPAPEAAPPAPSVSEAPVAPPVTEPVVEGIVEAYAPPADEGPALPAEATTAPAEALPAAAVLPGREAPVERAEMARVDAELLDSMLNNAGEVSIFRARLEQQLSSIEFNLAELGRVVQRFKDQLRKLEIETEAQILHRHVEHAPRREDFDPLELDRYSSIQQYSRALTETAADVGSVQNLLENQTREAQNLLTQQHRVVTDLQGGLMRTRMVPFQRHVQRLTRIVRQAAADAGKRVDLVVQGATGELDRQVLERMLPPFEHLLRNCVVHGLESPAERAATGKPATGRIDVSLKREGSEVVIVVADDGAGINLRAVREKAVMRGLLGPKQEISDEEAIQLILEPGFSTATRVTQAAGRGVGMDVVASEVKKLGGALQIETWPGRGTRFTVRLPFTLAISQALVVRSGDELYALPLPTVEGVVRMPKSEVVRHLAEDTPTFDYGGQRYRFQHLGLFVGGMAAVLPEQEAAVPVTLVRAGEHSTAIVTDELLGSREIVVKSVGPMISGIRGISGATILGDGRICIILDMGALVRSEWRTRALRPAEQGRGDNRVFALVVDDSITVRRVTQRLLERNGMRVMTAKDGLDAIAVLQDNLPDVMLLDIEMPRMDGYEVASHVRNDPRLKHIPIVMITSRVGEKHRARAIELGIDEYLGKPYQEAQLLEAIEPLVQKRGVKP